MNKVKTPDKGFPRTEMKPNVELSADRWVEIRFRNTWWRLFDAQSCRWVAIGDSIAGFVTRGAARLYARQNGWGVINDN